MVGELDELGMSASYIAELGRAELGQVGLGIMSAVSRQHFVIAAYIDVEAQDGVLATGALKSGNLGLELVLFSRLLGL